ncbi:YqgQ family protein [Virgibacillus kekensis]|uniref:YqgQ family protein n=1 Tax=Virgibacillus kekensis TaxID=202261 RepID=A0ABV9DLE1_9BACI
MKTVYDIQQLLKRFGTFIYTGNRIADLELMEGEIKELYDARFIDVTQYKTALLLLRQEASRVRDQKGADS